LIGTKRLDQGDLVKSWYVKRTRGQWIALHDDWALSREEQALA